MHFTRVLFRGYNRTPKNYQNVPGFKGVLTHTQNVISIPRIPVVPGALHKG